jgi:short-subunit dehydrogenase
MPVADVEINAVRTKFDINFWAPFGITQVFLPLLIAAREQGERATFVLRGSLAGVSATPFSVVYGAAKAAASYLTNVIRMKLTPWGVDVVEFKIGTVRSNMTHSLRESGAQKPSLPPDPLYAVVKDSVEKLMSGESASTGTHQDEWVRMLTGKWKRRRLQRPYAVVSTPFRDG